MKPATGARTRTLIALIAAVSASLTLAGCGQKGNLYLPNQKKKVPSAPQTQPQPAPPAPPGDPPASPNSGA
jgi:predicted small lipoprotein YifL